MDLFGNAWGPGNVYVSLYSGGDQAIPGTTLLGTLSRPAESMSGTGIVSFDLSSLNTFVTAGQTYTFSLAADPCFPGDPVCTLFSNIVDFPDGTTSAGYAGGAASVLFYGSLYDLGGDHNFRTWVDPDVTAGAVPEPATWALMLLGFGFVGGTLRASRRRNVTVAYA